MASAQGTMNNFTFGNARHQYYETISGGSARASRASAPAPTSGASTAPTWCRRT